MQKYPVGTQTFSILREQGSVYVDKTAHIQQLIENHRFCFLARPRRFGKSLTLSTIASIFRAERELFAGLAIERSDYNWQKHPVIHISLGGIESVNEEHLMYYLREELRSNGEKLGIAESSFDKPDISIGLAFTLLIKQAGKDKPAVLLIDEYDKLLVNVLDRPELFERNRDIMAGFYRVIKDLDPYLRFCMLTGISRFGRLSLFSELNNLRDITYDDAYATLCGYTEAELEEYFTEELSMDNSPTVSSLPARRVSIRQEIQEWYNGYRFGMYSTETVYNPFCLLQYFQSGNTLSGYWINSGTTSLLVKLARRNNYLLINLKNAKTTERKQAVFNPEEIGFESLLLQTGYLTIDHVQLEENNVTYYLRVPNREVQGVLDDTLLEALTGKDITQNYETIDSLYVALIRSDQDNLKEAIYSVCAGVPNEWYANLRTESKFEALYCALLYTLFYTTPKVQLRAEESSALGRADLVLELEEAGTIFVVEVKVNADVSEALQQIIKKGYLEKYKSSGKKLYALVCIFSTQERNISELAIVPEEELP